MSAPDPDGHGSRRGTIVVSALFVVAGILTLQDTTTYSDVDSKVFPRAAAILLILCASIALVSGLIASRRSDPSAQEGFGEGSWWRRGLLIAAMLACCLMMPVTGFLPASAVAFAGGLLAAMHDRWSVRTAALYWGAGAIVLGAFYALFRFALHVPLP